MRQYLEAFFHEFTYQEEDSVVLLSSYDTIKTNTEADALLSEILSMYEKCFSLDYEKDILKREYLGSLASKGVFERIFVLSNRKGVATVEKIISDGRVMHHN